MQIDVWGFDLVYKTRVTGGWYSYISLCDDAFTGSDPSGKLFKGSENDLTITLQCFTNVGSVLCLGAHVDFPHH